MHVSSLTNTVLSGLKELVYGTKFDSKEMKISRNNSIQQYLGMLDVSGPYFKVGAFKLKIVSHQLGRTIPRVSFSERNMQVPGTPSIPVPTAKLLLG